MDFLTTLDREYKWILQIKDYFTKIVQLQALKNKTIGGVLVELEEQIDKYRELITDSLVDA